MLKDSFNADLRLVLQRLAKAARTGEQANGPAYVARPTATQPIRPQPANALPRRQHRPATRDAVT